MEAFDILLTASFWVAAIRIASPLIFATLGELICERAGVLNLGIEGIMTAGAFAGWFTVYAGGDLWTGVLVAALVGVALGLLHSTLTVPLGLSQHVVGIGVTLLATSLTYFIYRLALPEVTSPPKIESFQIWAVPGLSRIPIVGEALFAQTPLTYLAFVMVGLVAWLLYRTPLGLAVRAAGENPSAVEAQGISVTGIRMGAVMAGSALMAVGGAFLTMSAFNSFFFGMINGLFNQVALLFAVLHMQILAPALLFGSTGLTLMFSSLMVSTCCHPSAVMRSCTAYCVPGHDADFPRDHRRPPSLEEEQLWEREREFSSL